MTECVQGRVIAVARHGRARAPCGGQSEAAASRQLAANTARPAHTPVVRSVTRAHATRVTLTRSTVAERIPIPYPYETAGSCIVVADTVAARVTDHCTPYRVYSVQQSLMTYNLALGPLWRILWHRGTYDVYSERGCKN